MPFDFDNQFVTDFPWAGELTAPTPIAPEPHIFAINDVLARDLNLEDISEQQWLACCAQGQLVSGMQSFAQVYAGHQFGDFVPRLGDGRALLLGQHRDATGQLWDLQLKGAGKTPYSRFGDGRAVLRSSIREYLASEALHYLDIPTTRALVLTHSQEPVYREDVEYAATLLRVAPSHLRFGHLEYFSHQGDVKAVMELVAHTMDVHYPEVETDNFAQWFREVMQRTARLIAKWQAYGFCHGVLNTDNMSLIGLTLDYGPYGFLEAYDPKHICNASDTVGRYAFDRQPAVGLWNLQRLAQAIGFLIPADQVDAILQDYQTCLLREYSQIICNKIGILELKETDPELVRDMFTLMARDRLDFTLFFRALCSVEAQGGCPNPLRSLINNNADWMQWLVHYQTRLRQEERSDAQRQESMRAANPAFVLRNWVAQTVIDAGEKGNTQVFNEVMHLIQNPFSTDIEDSPFTQTAPETMQSLEVSCSS